MARNAAITRVRGVNSRKSVVPYVPAVARLTGELQPLVHHVSDEKRPDLCGIAAYFGKTSVLEIHLSPRTILRIRTPRKVPVMHGVRRDTATIGKHSRR